MLLLILLVAISGAVLWNRLGASVFHGRFLDETACPLPCWSGITPGRSNPDEALRQLEGNSDVKHLSLKQHGDLNNGGATWEWIAPSRRTLPKVVWIDGVVEQIVLGVPDGISLQAGIDKLGEPEALVATMGGQPEHWYWIVDLYYPGKGVELKAYLPELSDQLDGTSAVDVVILFKPTDLEQRIAEEFDDPEAVALQTGLVRTWRGYGSLVSVYYPESAQGQP